jgi:hypothetical protein
MTSARMPGPPRFLVRLFLVAAPFVLVLLVILGVLAASRGYDVTAARMFALGLAQAGGWMYAWRRRAWLRKG